MSCQQCYALSFQIAESYLIPAGLNPNTNYYLWLYKPNSNPYSYQVATDLNGSLTIQSSEFPQGFFNQYGGDYQLNVSTDAQGQDLVRVYFSVIPYDCVLLIFECCG